MIAKGLIVLRIVLSCLQNNLLCFIAIAYSLITIINIRISIDDIDNVMNLQLFIQAVKWQYKKMCDFL